MRSARTAGRVHAAGPAAVHAACPGSAVCASVRAPLRTAAGRHAPRSVQGCGGGMKLPPKVWPGSAHHARQQPSTSRPRPGCPDAADGADGEPSPDLHPLLWRGLPGDARPLRCVSGIIESGGSENAGVVRGSRPQPVLFRPLMPAPCRCCVRHLRFPAGSICWPRRSMQACACQLTAPPAVCSCTGSKPADVL